MKNFKFAIFGFLALILALTVPIVVAAEKDVAKTELSLSQYQTVEMDGVVFVALDRHSPDRQSFYTNSTKTETVTKYEISPGPDWDAEHEKLYSSKEIGFILFKPATFLFVNKAEKGYRSYMEPLNRSRQVSTKSA